MSSHPEMGSQLVEDPRLDFASFTPADPFTYRGLQQVIETIDNGSPGSNHHTKFIRLQPGNLAGARSPPLSPELDSISVATTEEGGSDDDDLPREAAACFVLSLKPDAHPYQPETGYFFGSGDLKRWPDTAGVDLLLPPSSPGEFLVYARHGYFAFDSTKYSQLWIHARHSGIKVNDRPLARKSKMLVESRARISVGPYRYIFEFKVTDEKVFQAAKQQFLLTHRGAGEPFESTSATPSTSDIRIQDWLIRGVVGVSPITVIHAATHIRSGEVVAVKRLRFGASLQDAEKEVQLYDDIATDIRGHPYSPFVMQKHSVLSNEQASTSIREGYLLWKPLARGDFTKFGKSGDWEDQHQDVKKTVFVQILLGLSALHDRGWIHRDLKPANLGIVDLGQKPLAIIMDEAQAIRSTTEGHRPRIGHCGSVGYLAPELESSSYSRSYGKAIDIWSMGAVGAYLFFYGKIPWGGRAKPFLEGGTSYNNFLCYKLALLARPKDDLGWLIGSMLEEKPEDRPTLQEILSHVSLRFNRQAIDLTLSMSTQTGMKRNRTTQAAP